MDLIVPYLIIINAASFLLMLADKYNAIEKLRRIPEAGLMTFALLGGSVGTLLGMYLFRHKTRRRKFTVGIPVLAILQAAILGYLQFHI